MTATDLNLLKRRADTRGDGPRDTLTMSEPERRMLSRTD